MLAEDHPQIKSIQDQEILADSNKWLHHSEELRKRLCYQASQRVLVVKLALVAFLIIPGSWRHQE